MWRLSLKKTLTLDLGVHQQGASWRVCTKSGTPERHLSAGCEKNGQHRGVPAGPQRPDTDEDKQTTALIRPFRWDTSIMIEIYGRAVLMTPSVPTGPMNTVHFYNRM